MTDKELRCLIQRIKENKYLTRDETNYIIKALEQESCNDTISRAEAIRIASGYCHTANIAKELGKLPPIQPEQKTWEWTPVSVRLPKKNGRYLVTVKNLTGYEHLDNNVFECEFYGDWIFKGWEDNKVIAWMPLPEPYKAESEE